MKKFDEKFQSILNKIQYKYPQSAYQLQTLQRFLQQNFLPKHIIDEKQNDLFLFTQDLYQITEKIRKNITKLYQHTKNQQVYHLYESFLKIIEPIHHYHQNSHQLPFYNMHKNSTFMKMHLLEQLKTQIQKRKKAEKQAESLYSGLGEALRIKQENIKEIQSTCQKLQGINKGLTKQNHKLRHECGQLQIQLKKIKNKDNFQQNQCLEHLQAIKLLQDQNKDLIKKIKELKDSPKQTQNIENILEKAVNKVISLNKAKQQSKIAESKGYPYQQQESQNLLGFYQSNGFKDKQSPKSKIKNFANKFSKNSNVQPATQGDDLWRFLLVQAVSIQDFIQSDGKY